MLKAVRALRVVAAISILGSCGGTDAIVGPTLASAPAPVTATVTMSQDSATLIPVATIQLSATPKDASGTQLSRPIAWSTSDQSKAVVSATGLVTAVAPGVATITATAEGKQGSALIVIRDGAIIGDAGGTAATTDGAAQVVVPAGAVAGSTNISIVPSASLSEAVVPLASFDFGPAGTVFAKPVTLAMTYDPARLPAGAEESGLELFLRSGNTWEPVAGSTVNAKTKTVTAQISHFSTYAILPPVPVAEVTIAGISRTITGAALSLVAEDTASLTATPKDAGGRVLGGRTLSWSSSDSTVAQMSVAGLISALKPGTASISATIGGKTSSIALTVTPIPVATITIASSTSFFVGDTARAAATTLDAKGRPLTGRAVSWTTSAADVATVSTDGLVTAIAPGAADITAASEGKSAKVAVTVSLRPVASVSVSLASSTVVAGATAQASAVLKDANGAVLTGRPVEWTSSAPAIATVSATGLVTAVASGTATISAASEGKSGSATVTVTPVPVSTVTVSLAASGIFVGGTTQATAQTKDANGNVLTGRSITWSSSAPAVATVSASGLVTGVSAGSASITATSEGKTGSATVSVSVVPVATVSVSLAASSLASGATTQATAVTKDAAGSVLTGRSIAWSSSAPAIATVSASGLVTAVSAGTASITATSEGQNGSATVTVTAVPQLNLTVDGMYLVQSVQTYSRTVPLVKDRDAYLRVFVKANIANSAAPQVRVRLYSNGALFQTTTATFSATSTPTTIDEGDARASVNIKILGTSVQPGLSVLADVDPSNSFAEANESDNQYPADGTPAAIDVRSTAPARVTFVPVLQSVNGLQGNVTVGNASSFMDFANRIHPYASSSVLVHAAYTTSAPALDATDSNSAWNTILNEVEALRVAEGTAFNYYGVVKVSYSSGVAGLAFVDGKSGAGVDWGSGVGSQVFAHEIGHNWGRLHSPCGGPTDIDASYPYSDGGVGVFGVDVAADSLVAPNNKFDVMSYCHPQWISDYTYKGVLSYRATAAQPDVLAVPSIRNSFARSTVVADPTRSLGGFTGSPVTGTTAMSVQSLADVSLQNGGAVEPSTVIWGRITRRGLVLEPAFSATTTPSLAKATGPYSIEALDAGGASLFRMSFRPDTVADAPDGARMFAFAVPTRLLDSNRIQKIRISGEGQVAEISASLAPATPADASVTTSVDAAGATRVQWDSDRFPLLVVRDSRTGEILSLARGGSQIIPAPAAALDFTLSDAVHSKVGAGEIR